MFRSLNLGVAFLLELAMLAAFAYWGFTTGETTPVRLLLGIGTPLVAILLWARFMAPRSETRLTGTRYLLVKLVLFGLAAMLLGVAGQPLWAAIFAVVAVINQLLLTRWQQE